MAGTTVTTLAKKKMVKARAGISSLPKIVGMAFGDGGVDSGGTVKPHSADQNTLHHELLRKNVDGYEVLSDTKIRYRCTLAENELANTYILLFVKVRVPLDDENKITMNRLNRILMNCGFSVLKPDQEFDRFVIRFLRSTEPLDVLEEEVEKQVIQGKNFYLYKVYRDSYCHQKELLDYLV